MVRDSRLPDTAVEPDMNRNLLCCCGKRTSTTCSGELVALTEQLDFISHNSVCCRCGKARVQWKQAEWCWVRPTPLSPSPEPSEETSASTSASECGFHSNAEMSNCFQIKRSGIVFLVLVLTHCVVSSQEHHPRQRLSGECQQGDRSVVPTGRAVQLQQLCLQLALLSWAGYSAAVNTLWLETSETFCLRFPILTCSLCLIPTRHHTVLGPALCRGPTSAPDSFQSSIPL